MNKQVGDKIFVHVLEIFLKKRKNSKSRITFMRKKERPQNLKRQVGDKIFAHV